MNKPIFPFLAAAFTWILSIVIVAPSRGQVRDLQANQSDDGIALRWTIDPVNNSSPYLFPSVQIEMSRNLETWEDVGEPIALPASPGQASPSHSADIVVPDGETGVYIRLRSFFDGVGKSYVGVDFSGADLRGATFEGADLTGAVFDYAVLTGARFVDTKLTGSSWEGALIEGAEFTGTALDGLDFYRNVIGSPNVTRIAGDGDSQLSETLPAIRHFARGIDFPGGYGGLEKFRVSHNTALCLLRHDMTIRELNDLLATHNCTLIGSGPSTSGRPHFAALRTPTKTHDQLASVLDSLQTAPGVLHAAWDSVVDTFSIPSKTDAKNWDWDKDSGGNWGWHMIKAPQMWNLNEAVEKALEKSGKKPPLTGLIDRDTYAGHPDFADALHTNFYSGGDTIGHGTHVGGIIAAAHNKSYIDGVNPFGRLFIANVPHLSDFAPIWIDRSRAALGKYSREILGDYVDHVGEWMSGLVEVIEDVAETPVINVSEGLRLREIAAGVSLDELKNIVSPIVSRQGGLITRFAPRDGVVISAAGNDSESIFDDAGKPIDVPAALASPFNWAALVDGVPNIVVVQSMGRNGERLPSSNVGGHLIAPGEEILSLGKDGTEYRSGTSQAAAFVSGVASYLTAVDPDLEIDGLYQIIRDRGNDGWAAVMDIDGLGAGHRVLEMLCDFDDGSEDGNTRLDVDPGSAKSDRNFKPVTGGTENQDDDVDDDGGPGDGVIDISDFRRWRDALLYIEGDESLNGSKKHSKHDLNRDGSSDGRKREEVYPRADFNGDGKLDRDSISLMTGVHAGRQLTDLAVLTEAPSGIWSDMHYDLTDLEQLIDSVDLHVSAANFFNKNKEIGVLEVVIGVYQKGEDKPLYKKRKLTREDSTEIITVPVDAEYEVRSELVNARNYRVIQLVSPGSCEVKRRQRGADLAIDLVPLEQTVRTTLLSQDVELVDSDPLVERVESTIKATNDLAETQRPQGGAAFANDQMTFDGGVITGTLEDFPGGAGAETMIAEVILHRSFIKQPNVPNPKFRVSPTRLRIVDGAINQDKRALVDLRLEKRVGLGEWKPTFHTRTEIAGQVFNDGSHNFRITDHQGDRPQEELEIIKTVYEGIETFVGAEYIAKEPYVGEVSLDDVEEGATFELRYTLIAEGFSALTDEVAEAYIGDPLDYGEPSLTMEYGTFGELFSISDVEAIPEGGAKVTHRSRLDYYFVLQRTSDGKKIAAALGQDELGELIDDSAEAGIGENAYHVRGIPINRPEDQDRDGIDDVYELLRPEILDPLNPDDAREDPDKDGFNNLTEFGRESDPQVFDEGGSSPGRDYVFPGTLLPIQGADLHSTDLNNDGRLDFVSRVGGRDGHIEAILASPDVYFQQPVETAVSGSELDDLAVGKLDADPFPDAVLLDGSANGKVTILLGDGNGAFTPGDSYEVGAVPSGIALGDADADGALDILVVLGRARQVLILTNKGGGAFAEETGRITLDATPTDVAVGHVDADSPELVITHRKFLGDGNVSIFRRSGNAFEEYATFAVGASPVRVIPGDVNRDGADDFVTANSNSDDVSVILSTGDGGFSPPVHYTVGDSPRGLLLQDVTGDGHLDLFVSHEKASFVSLLLGKTAGDFFPAKRVYTKASEQDPITGDWNGDGIVDLATGTLVVNGAGGGNFDTRRQIDIPDASIRTVATGDVDGDGEAEIVALSASRPAFFEVWKPGPPDGQPEKIGRAEVVSEPVAMVLADVDRDGKQEIVVASKEPRSSGGANQISIFAGDAGSYSVIAEFPLEEAPSEIIASELNGDDAPDLLVQLPQKAIPFVNNGEGGFTAEPAIAPGSMMTARDLNGDQRDEVILSEFSVLTVSSTFHVFSRGEQGDYSQIQTLDYAGASQKLFWADANGDGREDLISIGSDPGATTPLRHAAVEDGQLENLADWIRVERGSVNYGDLNRDGATDILVDGSTLYLSTNDGDSGFERQEIFAGGAQSAIFTDGFESGDLSVISWDWSGNFIGLLEPKL